MPKAEGVILGAMKLMKKFLRRKIGPHAFIREIPEEDAGTNSVKRYREDCDVHTAAQCCITTGVLAGVAYLDAKRTITVEDDDGMVDDVELSLRDVLAGVELEGKPLIRVVAELNDSTVMVVSATSPERDALLENICQYIAAWTMFTLVFQHNGTPETVEGALRSWFGITHAKAAMEYAVFDDETGMVSLEVESGDPDGREAQELLREGLVDMSIVKGEDIEAGQEKAGKDYDSDDSDMTRGSQDTRMYQNRIFGLKGAAKKMAAQNKSERPGGKADEPHPGPARDGDTAAEEAGSSTGPPSPESGADSEAEADAK